MVTKGFSHIKQVFLRNKVRVLGTACMVQFDYLFMQILLQREMKAVLSLPYTKTNKVIQISGCLLESV